MTVRINKSAFNIREKLSELERPIGLKGSELMRAETAQEARDFVSAGRKNLIINGAMQVAQRGTSETISGAANNFVVDRFWISSGGGFSWNSAVISKSTTAPEGFAASLKVDVGSTSTPTGGHNAAISQRIEAQNLQHLGYGTAAAKTCTLSFWVRSNKTGTYCLQAIQPDSGSNYVMYEYTINSADTWEKKTITIVGNTNAAIADDNGNGIDLNWHLACGPSDYVATQSTWSGAVGYRATSNQVNLFDNAANEWYLTGVQLEVGKNATEFEHRSFSEEFALCERYFQKNSYGSLMWASPRSPQNSYTNLTYGVFRFRTAMRATPTVGIIGSNFSGVRYNGSGYTASSIALTTNSGTGHVTTEYTGPEGLIVRIDWGFNWTANDLVNVAVTNSDSAMTFSAEL